MYILTLSVHFKKHRVFADCERSPKTKNLGGTMRTIYPGGSFMGLSVDSLVQLGSERHEITECDERDFQNLGKAPEYESESAAKLAWFESILFGYQQGA